MYHLTMGHDYVSVTSTQHRGRVEVRGRPDYATDHRADDPLHQFLDSLDPPTVSQLFADGKASPNPKNSRADCSFVALAQLFRDNP
jgi:hypothetical protein